MRSGESSRKIAIGATEIGWSTHYIEEGGKRGRGAARLVACERLLSRERQVVQLDESERVRDRASARSRASEFSPDER